MCSILGIFNIKKDPQILRQHALKLSKLQRHRGPDWNGIFADNNAILVHERLAIVDPITGAQPISDRQGLRHLAANGEIYNHNELRSGTNYDFTTGSDCEVILALYHQRGIEFLNDLNGIYAFALYDQQKQTYLIARDPIGVVPLYYGTDQDGVLFVASEMKTIQTVCPEVKVFPPGHYLTPSTKEPQSFYNRDWQSFEGTSKTFNQGDVKSLKSRLVQAVDRQLMSDVPHGVLVSGGLDSSIIAAIAARKSETKLKSFSIGLQGSPDLAAAQKAADYIGTDHQPIEFTIQQGLDALHDVIYHLETYDVTTIRASTPMYLMARYIKAFGIKMVLSGEGADEIFGGYLYFHKAPSAEAFHKETVDKIANLHYYDCLRANKSMAAWGVEARVPFLDLQFLDTAMTLAPSVKMSGNGKMEKAILRSAFEDYLPSDIVWRQKEQFSDGVGYGWIDHLKQYANEQISDVKLERAAEIYPINPPTTKEAMLYRDIFTTMFPSDAAARTVPGGPSIACSTPAAILWDPSFSANADPSGRAVSQVHQSGL